MQVGTDWVIATTGGPSSSANLGILECGSNSACSGGRANPGSYARWRWFQPSGIAGGVTVLGVNGATLMLDVGGHELNFSLATDTFAAAMGA